MSLAESTESPAKPLPTAAELSPEKQVAAAETTPAPAAPKGPEGGPKEPSPGAADASPSQPAPRTAAKSPKPVTDVAEKPKKEPRKRDRKSTAKRAKKPSKIIKLRLANNEAAPTFDSVDTSGNKVELFWLRVQIREFLLRFDKLCRIPARYLNSLNDVTSPWTDQLYKSVIAALFRLFSYDKTWLIPLAKQYIPLVEDSPAESSELWTLLYDFLVQIDPYASATDSLNGEHYRLELIRRLMVQSAATDTIRSTVINDHESLQQLKKENADQIKLLQDQYADKLEQLKQNKETFADKKARAERITADKIFKAEQLMYSRLRKYSLRTSPVGKDNFGNTYWILQQKGKELWGSSIVCEMKVFPDDEELMVLKSGDGKDSEGAGKKPPQSKETADSPNGSANNAPTEGDSEEPSAAEPKRKRRRYVVPKRDYLTDREASTNYVSGQENILTLAGWIRGQVGPKQDTLATEIETMAYYCCID